MKNFDDFRKIMSGDPGIQIHEKLRTTLVETYKTKKANGLSPDEALSAATIQSLAAFSFDLLEKYHEWLHAD